MKIGYNIKKQPLEIDVQKLSEHLLLVGSTGSGKTNFLIYLIFAVSLLVQGLWVFDYRKKDFSSIRPALKKAGVDLIVLSGESLRFNLLQPPLGVSTSIWAVIISDLLQEGLVLPQRASKLLQVHIMKLYAAFGGQAKMEASKHYPCLFDLIDSIKKDIKSNYQAARAVLDNLEPLLLAHGDILSCRYGWDVKKMTSRHIVFELNGLLETAKNLVTGYILISEFIRRTEAGVSNILLNLIAVCDESQRLISSSGSVGSNVIKNQIGLVRGTGMGMVFSVQSASDILPEVISNTASKVISRCGSHEDYLAIGRAMGLTREQIQWAKQKLQTGKFIVQLNSSRFREPFVLTVPNMDKYKSRVPQRADSDPFEDMTVVPFKSDSKLAQKAILSSFDSDQDFRFCRAVANNPLLNSSAYSKLAKVSPKSIKKIRERLVAEKLLRLHVLETGGRGRGSMLLEVTEQGLKAIADYENQESQHAKG